MARSDTLGFTLIELMIVVVIVGILATIAYPSYQRWVVETRRSDAQIALARLANDQEKFYSDCGVYATSLTANRNCTDRGLQRANDQSPEGYYRLAIANVSATSFTVTATPIGPQATADPECTQLALDSAGRKTATGSNTARCWRK